MSTLKVPVHVVQGIVKEILKSPAFRFHPPTYQISAESKRGNVAFAQMMRRTQDSHLS